MSTAQEALADAVIRRITPGGDIAQVNKYTAGIIEFVSKGTKTLNGVVGVPPATNFGGGILPFFTHVVGKPWKEYLVFPSTTAAGDTVSVTIDNNQYDVTLPANFNATGQPIKYDGDRINGTIPNAELIAGAGDELGGPIVQVNTQRLAPGQRGLVVYEHQPATAGGGRMFALNPNQASGIPLPAFRTVAVTPATGTLVGEGILNTTSGVPYIWDGLQWKSVVPPSVVTYPTDADVLNDGVAVAGTYAFSVATGNLFVRFNDGTADVWRQIGLMVFPTEAGLLAHVSPDGSAAYAQDTERRWLRINGAWVPESFMRDTEANIKAATPTAGLLAISTDTGKVFYGDGAQWIGQPFREYATEVALRADTPVDGIMAVAVDTGAVFYRTGGNWISVNGITMPVGATEPAAPAQGDLFYNATDKQAKVWTGTAWQVLGAGSIDDLTDVDTTTDAPQDKEALIWDNAAKQWKPGKGGGVVMGNQPAAGDRYDGMLWWSGARLFVWVVAANAWVEC